MTSLSVKFCQGKTSQSSKAQQFRALHIKGAPLILFNVWDPGSAKAVASAQARAIATGSWSVAAAHGFADGEKLPLELAIANLARIVAATDLPVSIDVESGYADPARTIAQTIEAGAIGCNLEDSFPHDGALREITAQAVRIKAARHAAEAAGIDYFINARTDVFYGKDLEKTESASLQCVLERANAYADAGANGIFVPGLTDLDLVAQLCAASPLPVNIMVSVFPASPQESDPLKIVAYAKAGVARLSFGPAPYVLAMKALENAARRLVL
jgi:2-methylisocitrate lyase-like PEP mutase family enzyme